MFARDPNFEESTSDETRAYEAQKFSKKYNMPRLAYCERFGTKELSASCSICLREIGPPRPIFFFGIKNTCQTSTLILTLTSFSCKSELDLGLIRK
jgi:hypothetical protein